MWLLNNLWNWISGFNSEKIEWPICLNPLAPFDCEDPTSGTEEFRYVVTADKRKFTPNYCPGFPQEKVSYELLGVKHTINEWKELDKRFEILYDDGWREGKLNQNKEISCEEYLQHRRNSTLQVR